MKWQPISTAHKLPGIDYWSVRLGNVWALSNSEKQPTHWMPLPEPPHA